MAVVGAALAVAAPSAGAKVLPIASVHTSTTTPTAGTPFAIVVRFQPGKDFIDAGWEDDEVTIRPASDLDASGWPTDYSGIRVPIHRFRFGGFRGTATVRTPGDYVIVDSSGVSAHQEILEGVVNVAPGPAPVRIHVVAATVAHPAGHDDRTVVIIGGAVLLVLVLLGALVRRGARTARGDARTPEPTVADDRPVEPAGR